MKSGFVSLVGRPNAGKSTLLNALIGEKVAITSEVAGTTRNMIQGIYHDKDLQIIFVDTPGIHKPQNELGRILNKQAYLSLEDVDLIVLVIDITKDFGKGDKFILEKLKEVKKPVLLILNKIDKIPYEQILPKIALYKELYPFQEIIPLSATKKINFSNLINAIATYLQDDIPYYDDKTITNVSLDFTIQELIREKVLLLTHEEVPHSVTCKIEGLEITKDRALIYATLIVDRENLKKILVGKSGQMIKKIGIEARKDIEKTLKKTVYLDLKVKVVPHWREREEFLKEIGYQDFQN